MYILGLSLILSLHSCASCQVGIATRSRKTRHLEQQHCGRHIVKELVGDVYNPKPTILT